MVYAAKKWQLPKRAGRRGRMDHFPIISLYLKPDII